MAKRAKRRPEPEEDNDEDRSILQEAKDRFKRCQDYESDFRRLYLMDVKFNLADADNGWQWPDDLRRDREANKRPALTINKTARLVSMITNDARENKPSVSIKPTGQEASFKSAQVYEGLVRDIEYKSTAQAIYDEAVDSQVEGGIGYWRVNTIYTDDDSFDQEIRIQPVQNQLGVYLDPDIKQKDGSDALFGFIFTEEPRQEFEKRHPDFDLQNAGNNTGLDEADTWVRDDQVRSAEYYRILEKNDELFYVEDDKQSEPLIFKASEAPKGFRDTLIPGKFKSRKIVTRQLEWFKIVGDRIMDRRKLKGTYVPIVRVVGIERVIEGKLERKGFVRGLKDPQRMFNFNASQEVEGVALQTKVPFFGPKAAFEGNETMWANANRQNYAYLSYNHLDADGNPLPPPQRMEPPKSVEAFLQGMQVADNQLAMVAGMENAHQGRDGNERSGKAISERQRQGDKANALWINNLAMAIRFTGRIIIDLVPHTYDTKRVVQILNVDGTQAEVTIDPNADQAYQEVKEPDIVRVMFNPNVGKYEVQSDVGPAYATQRQEAWNAFTQIVTGAPDMIGKIGDLMFRAADFPMADKIAERLRRDINANAAYLLDDNMPTPQVAQLQQALEAAQGQVGELIQKLAEKNIELKNRDDENAIKRHEADSKRLTAETNSIVDLKNSQVEMNKLLQAITETLADMRSDRLTEADNTITEANPVGDDAINDENEIPPFEGAQKGKDGNWYLQNGKQWMGILPGASQ